MIVAIDGPAGSGKTTIARILSEKINFSYLNTGATYRALVYKALNESADLSNSNNLEALAKHLEVNIVKDKIFLDGNDISLEIRSPYVDKNISLVVSYPAVRKIMVKLQKKIAEKGDYVVEGRDITTVVFPDAKFKFYLDASPQIRAERRFKELQGNGLRISFVEVKEDLEKRDYADKNRKVSPLKISSDALYIDTTGLTITESAERIISCIKI